MNGAGPSPVSWDSVLARAHRRFWVRLAALGAIGAIGAALLLGGGAATRAAIQEDGPASSPPSPPANDEKPNLTFGELIAKEKGGSEGEKSIWTVTVTVKNTSTVDAPPFDVAIAAEGGGNDPMPLEFGPLAAEEESEQKTFPCPGTSASVEIDPDGEVEEDHRGDNQDTIECASTEPPDNPTNGNGDDDPPDPEHELETDEDARELKETANQAAEEKAETEKDAKAEEVPGGAE